MKRKTTKEILAESFRELAENRPVDKITIQEIVDNCDYSPATFYRHFKDKYDMIAWDYVHRTTCAVPSYLIISAEFGTWGGEIDETQLPARFYVDYARVYSPLT